MKQINEWDVIYGERRHMNRWPWSDLVSLVSKFVPDLRGKRVLELGTGTGGNIAFLLERGCSYFGIEQSSNGMSVVPAPYATLVKQADFTREIPYLGAFDVIVDRASMIHNAEDSIERGLDLVRSRMVNGGVYIGVDWFSVEHGDTEQFDDLSVTSFVSQTLMLHFFRYFESIVHLEHKRRARLIPCLPAFAAFDIVAIK